MQKQLKISINGRQYSIATDENHQDVIEAAQLVDALMKSNIEKMPNVSDDKIALLVALHLATDLAKSRRLLEEGEVILGGIVQKLDQAI